VRDGCFRAAIPLPGTTLLPAVRPGLQQLAFPWQNYGNPIIGNNKSSGIVVPDGQGYRLYTMHQQVDVFYPTTK